MLQRLRRCVIIFKMKKNIIILLLGWLMCIAVAAGVGYAVISGRHRHDYVQTVTPSDCINQGYTTYTCECGSSYKDNYIGARGHNYIDGECGICGYEHPHEYEKEVISPTCQGKGYSTYSCVCGVSYTDDETDIIEHIYVNGKCSMCGIDHDCKYTPTVTEPTCTEQGFTIYICACGANHIDDYTDPPGHSYRETVTEPTCTEMGYITHTCSACGHSYIDSYTDPLGHTFENGRCVRCGDLKPTDGLKYTLSDDGTYYICSGIGTATGTDIVIASIYDGKHVTAIAERAFKDCNSLESVFIPNGITAIGNYAFGNTDLTRLVIPDSVTTIENYAFYGCTKLVEITIPAGVTSLESYTFTNCTSLKTIYFKGTKEQWRSLPHTDWLKLTCEVQCSDGESGKDEQ